MGFLDNIKGMFGGDVEADQMRERAQKVGRERRQREGGRRWYERIKEEEAEEVVAKEVPEGLPITDEEAARWEAEGYTEEARERIYAERPEREAAEARMATPEEMEGALAAEEPTPGYPPMEMPEESTGLALPEPSERAIVRVEERALVPYHERPVSAPPEAEAAAYLRRENIEQQLTVLWGRMMHLEGIHPEAKQALDAADEALKKGDVREAADLARDAGAIIDEAEEKEVEPVAPEIEEELDLAALQQEFHNLRDEAARQGLNIDPLSKRIDAAFEEEDLIGATGLMDRLRARVKPPPPEEPPKPPYEKVPPEEPPRRRMREYREMEWPYGPPGEAIGVPEEVRPEMPCAFCDQLAKYTGAVQEQYVGTRMRDGSSVMSGQFYPMCPRHFEMYGVGLGAGRGQEIQPEVVPAGLTPEQARRLERAREAYPEAWSKLAEEAGRLGIPTTKVVRLYDSNLKQWVDKTVPKTGDELRQQIDQHRIARGEATLKRRGIAREQVGFWATGGPAKVPLQMGGRAVEWAAKPRAGIRPRPEAQLRGFYGQVSKETLGLGGMLNMPRIGTGAWAIGVGARRPSPGVLGPAPVVPHMPGVTPGPPVIPAVGVRGEVPTGASLYRAEPFARTGIEITAGPPVMGLDRAQPRVFRQNGRPRVFQPEIRSTT